MPSPTLAPTAKSQAIPASTATAISIGTTATTGTNKAIGQEAVVIPHKASTPLKSNTFRRYLRDHPDRGFVQMVLDIIDNGADIGFNGPRYPRFTKNSATAREFSEVLLKSITKEVASGHSVGPFSSPPFPNFVVSSLGVREKKTGGHRIIMDLSRPFGDSVNDHISPEDYSLAFCSVDDACNMLQTVGKGALMAKEDVKAAFRLIPVRPLDWPLLGYMVSGSYYFDVVLPFGCRSSPFLFCLFSYAVHWIL
ncbi:hypothetical protein RvY_13296, partial [Ramazzottius varieornatus]